MKLRICLPFYERISEPTRLGVQECLGYPHFQWDIKCLQSSRIAVARNSCLNDGLSENEHQDPVPGVEYFLFVDSDIGFHLKDVLALLTREVLIVSGAYIRQGDPENLCAGNWKEGIPGNANQWLPSFGTKGLLEVGFFGAGFLLIHRDALSTMIYPWFHEVTVRKNGTATILGEDQVFCRAAAVHKIPCLLDADVRVRHLGRKVSRFNWNFQGELSGVQHDPAGSTSEASKGPSQE
jgi:hypothetical protein